MKDILMGIKDTGLPFTFTLMACIFVALFIFKALKLAKMKWIVVFIPIIYMVVAFILYMIFPNA